MYNFFFVFEKCFYGMVVYSKCNVVSFLGYCIVGVELILM